MSENGTIEVRIKYGEIAPARHLTAWPIGDLAGLMRTLDQWGYVDDDGDTRETTYGQIAVTSTGAYFEIVVTDDEA